MTNASLRHISCKQRLDVYSMQSWCLDGKKQHFSDSELSKRLLLVNPDSVWFSSRQVDFSMKSEENAIIKALIDCLENSHLYSFTKLKRVTNKIRTLKSISTLFLFKFQKWEIFLENIFLKKSLFLINLRISLFLQCPKNT